MTEQNDKITIKNPLPFILGDINQHVDRILRDKGMSNKEISEAIMSFDKCPILDQFIASLRSELAEKEKETIEFNELRKAALSMMDSDRKKISHLTNLCEAADKVIHAYYNPHLDNFDECLERYDQLKNTKP